MGLALLISVVLLGPVAIRARAIRFPGHAYPDIMP
jgi:hypothetical protein